MKSAPRFILATSVVMAAAAVADDAIPTQWRPSFHRPAFNAMYAYPTSRDETPMKQVWHKMDFITPQDSPNGKLTSRVVLLEIDCQKMTTAVKRNIEYGADGRVLFDTTVPESALQWQKFTTNRLTDSPNDMVRTLALADSDSVCHSRTD